MKTLYAVMSVVGGCAVTPLALAGPPCGPVSVTQSNDLVTITPDGSVVCGVSDPDLHHQSSYLRRFDAMADDLQVCLVSFAIELASSGAGTQPLKVNVYGLASGVDFTFANLGAPLGSSPVAVADAVLVPISVPVAATVPAGMDMVVEIFLPNGIPLGNLFVIGSNPNGQTGPSYGACTFAGTPEPFDLAEVGFPDMHIIMEVQGSGPCPWDCESVPEGTVGINDFLDLLAQWGSPGTCDFDGGGVGINDFLALLANWGPCP